MVTTRGTRREALRTALVEIATERIAENGVVSLRARDIAAEAGCALGGIYTAFADLDDLILHVNAATLGRLGQELAAAVQGRHAGDALKALARTYAQFAFENRKLWSALFDHSMAHGGPSPDWLLAGHTALLEHVTAPLAAVQPNLSEKTLRVRARTYFAAVHGVVSMSLQQRFLGLPRECLEPELDAFVDMVVDASAEKGDDPSVP